MFVAITVWGDRVSPVLDCAKNLLVVEISARQVVDRKTERFDSELLPQNLIELSRQGVRLLICGAVSNELAMTVENCGIRLHPFLSGDVEKILEAVAHGRSVSAFAMPGCRCTGRWGTRRGGCQKTEIDPRRRSGNIH